MTEDKDNEATEIKSISKHVKAAYWMTLGFSALFFGVGAVQQYIVVCFQERGEPQVGKFTLILVYFCFFLGSLQAHRVVQIMGPRLCMVVTSLSYGLLVLSVWSGSILFSYVSAVLGGLSASFLWTGQNVVVNRIPNNESRRTAISDFWVRYSLGTGLGTLVLGLLIGMYSYNVPLLSYAVICLASMALFLKMPNDFVGWGGSKKTDLLPSFHLLTLFSAMTVFFVRFVYGLVISQVPLDLKETIGTGYVGLLTAPFFIVPLLVTKPTMHFSKSLGIFPLAAIGFAFCLLGILTLLMFAGQGMLIGLAVISIAVSSAILYPITNILPKRIADTLGTDLERVAGAFSLSGSSGILGGLLAVSFLSRTTAYSLTIVLICLSCMSLFVVASKTVDKP